jgi:LPS-assembly protein
MSKTMRKMWRATVGGLVLVATSVSTMTPDAWAQFAAPGSQISSKQPVTFQADRIDYDQKSNIVTLIGHVQAWQAGHVLFADRLLYDRNTNIADAIGHVVLISPDGQIVYSNYAELSRDMSNGIMSQMNVTLPLNAKLAANGARRTEGKLNELTRAVYTACDVCLKHPENAPLWQIHARTATQDLQHHMIEYKDAVMQIYGVPILWLPYFSHPDPSAKRQSGLLTPSIGVNSHLGGFAEIPYYWVIDNQSDAIITPILSTKDYAALDVKYRRDFNFGTVNLNPSAGLDQGRMQGAIFANGLFDLNNTWRAGFNFQRASSVSYLNDYSILPNVNELESTLYIEGFGQGSYARLDTSFYQGLVASVSDSQLPVVLPYGQYSYSGQPDAWGGNLSLGANAFNILRTTGTNTRRAAFSTDYKTPFQDSLGGLWSTDLHIDAAGYSASNLNDFPNYATRDSSNTARALPQVALNYRWPLMNDAGRLGSQLIEPIIQVIGAPNMGNNVNKTGIPNEDSDDFQFTDANLFGFNKYPGIDRLESGMRANLGLHTEWLLNNGSTIDSLVGQSYRTHKDTTFPDGSGLEDNVSDIVARISYTPASWLDLTYRTRFSHVNLQDRFIDAFATAGAPILRVSAGYLYSATNPYYYYDGSTPPASYYIPRNEITLGLSTTYKAWTLNTFLQRNIQTGEMDSTSVDGMWQNDCLALDLSFNRRDTSVAGDNGSTTVLFRVTFKTIGGIGFNAL